MFNQDIVKCSEVLIAQQLTIAFAESASAGRMVAEFSMVPDAGKFLKGGFACYDAGLKEKLLMVPEALIEQFTPESAEVTHAMAKGLQEIIPAAIHVAVTGLTTSGGSETSEKPVGTMFVCALVGEYELFAEKVIFDGEPEEIILQTVYYTAALLVSKLATV